ncbi:MAG: class I SAM-dependent methyltransferase [Spirochaetales bacterium]|nr:class I SAM-dependent methyltransferase [Spirochaetales bacterium]
MPEMMEIYKGYAPQYDELVNAEDYENNFSNFLLSEFDWSGSIVMEAGIGTGRVSKIYLDQITFLYGFDREPHMLKAAGRNLSKWSDKVKIAEGDNIALPSISKKADIFIEGWSFGHTMIENKGTMAETFDRIFASVKTNLRSGGRFVIIETMGTNVLTAAPPIQELADFYSILQNKYGFKQEVISTDYRFESLKEAVRICGFFFGEEMAKEIQEKGSPIVGEYTGLFHLTV